MLEKLKLLKSEILTSYQQGYIGKKTIKYYYDDGTFKVSDQITKNGRNGDAVVIIPIKENGNFVVIYELRPLTKGQTLLEFPAGMIDENENPEVAALRELKEETGYVPERIVPLEWHYQDQGCSKAIIYTYIAYNCKKVCEQNLDLEEKINVREMSYDKIIDEMNNKESDNFKDANSKIAILSLKK